jgi:uracil-DNA glycosylase
MIQTMEEMIAEITIIGDLVPCRNITRKLGDGTIVFEATENVPSGWKKVFEEALPEIISTEEIINEKFPGVPLTPVPEKVFNAFHLTPLSKVNVVIVGMDPYHDIIKSGPKSGQFRAQGASFSIDPTDGNIPPSLKNIYKEIKTNYPDFVIPNHGCLDSWGYQGVLLLNKCLTVVSSVHGGGPGTHKVIWDGFLTYVTQAIADANKFCIYVLWGKQAQAMKTFLPATAIILEAVHPSGLSASRGFFGCGHFKQINDELVKQGKCPIDWQI